jgi:hypothetical protein
MFYWFNGVEQAFMSGKNAGGKREKRGRFGETTSLPDREN